MSMIKIHTLYHIKKLKQMFSKRQYLFVLIFASGIILFNSYFLYGMSFTEYTIDGAFDGALSMHAWYS